MEIHVFKTGSSCWWDIVCPINKFTSRYYYPYEISGCMGELIEVRKVLHERGDIFVSNLNQINVKLFVVKEYFNSVAIWKLETWRTYCVDEILNNLVPEFRNEEK